MTASVLSLDGFQDLIDRLGGDLSSWPATDRIAADTLLSHSAEARALLVTAQSLDAGLAATPKAPSGLADRIVAAALGTPSGRKN